MGDHGSPHPFAHPTGSRIVAHVQIAIEPLVAGQRDGQGYESSLQCTYGCSFQRLRVEGAYAVA